MIRSLRWRLQLWHAVVLTCVLIMFGTVVYALQWQTRLQQTDAELDRVAQVLTSRLRGLFPTPRMNGPGPRPPHPPGPDRRGPPRPGDEARPEPGFSEPTIILPEQFGAAADVHPVFRDVSAIEEPADAASVVSPQNQAGSEGEVPAGKQAVANVDNSKEENPDGRRRDGRGFQRGNPRDGFREAFRDQQREGFRDGREPPGPWFGPPQGLGLPDEFKHLFEGDEQNSFYYSIWDQHGTILAKSKSTEDIPFPDLHTSTDRIPVRIVRTRGMWREVVHVSRFDINVLVGRSLQPDLSALHRSGLMLSLAGGTVLAIGLTGGWWLSSRAIRPIAAMTTTAQSISVKSLSKRIDVRSTATELEQLAAVLNSTFDRLQSSFERQSQFTADASHELRTPVAVILSHAELALARPRSPDDYRTAIQTCRRAALRMKSLIDSLLLLARFDTTAPELDLQQVDLECIVQEAVEMLQPLATEKRISLEYRSTRVLAIVDRERLFQVITNLISNAIRYNRPDGRVEVELTSADELAIIRVIDSGVGIAPDDLPRIFDRFYRVDKARSQAEGGCGLGLSICQTIVEAHQGNISATSEPNVGTTVQVRLPMRLQNQEDGAHVSSDSRLNPRVMPINEQCAVSRNV